MPSEIRPRKFERLAAELRELIQGGTLKPGDQLPTFAELHLQSGITKPTIVRAHTLLEREGLITRRRGHGIFVAKITDRVAPPGVMRDTVAILTRYTVPPAQQRHSPGWAFFTAAGMLESIHAAGRHAMILHPDKMGNQDIKWLTTQRPLGVILDDNYASDLEHLQLITESFSEAGIPMVAFGSMPFLNKCDRLESDHEQGAYLLTRWLIAHGRRRIVPLTVSGSHLQWMSMRLAGYRRAMAEAGLEPLNGVPADNPSETPANRSDFEMESRRHAGFLIEAMTGPDPCDALLVPTDGLIYSIAAACRIFGKEPNRDILLAGYDNYWPEVPERAWETAVPDVTVDKNNLQIGKELVKMLIDRIEGRLPDDPQVRFVPPDLIPVIEEGRLVFRP